MCSGLLFLPLSPSVIWVAKGNFEGQGYSRLAATWCMCKMKFVDRVSLNRAKGTGMGDNFCQGINSPQERRGLEG